MLATEAAFDLAVKMRNAPFVHRECQLLEVGKLYISCSQANNLLDGKVQKLL